MVDTEEQIWYLWRGPMRMLLFRYTYLQGIGMYYLLIEGYFPYLSRLSLLGF